MATTPAYLHKIHQDRLCKLLEVDLKGLDRLIRRKGFPAPTDSDKHGPFWSIKAVREWLTSSRYRPLASLLLDWWPDADGPAAYYGAEPKRYRATDPSRPQYCSIGARPAAQLSWCVGRCPTNR
jgi:hypothetical protein